MSIAVMIMATKPESTRVRVARVRERLLAERGCEPTVSEVARTVGVNHRTASAHLVRLFGPLGRDGRRNGQRENRDLLSPPAKPLTKSEVAARTAMVRRERLAATPDPPKPAEPSSVAALAKRDYFRAWRRIVAG